MEGCNAALHYCFLFLSRDYSPIASNNGEPQGPPLLLLRESVFV